MSSVSLNECKLFYFLFQLFQQSVLQLVKHFCLYSANFSILSIFTLFIIFSLTVYFFLYRLRPTKGFLQVGLGVNNYAVKYYGNLPFQSAGVPPIQHLHKYPCVIFSNIFYGVNINVSGYTTKHFHKNVFAR